MEKKNVWKKTAASSLALLMLAGGGTAVFAQPGNGDHGNKDDQKEKNGKHEDRGVTWKFKDEDELKWAMEHIMRLASKGVFTGYEDGSFKPNQKISRIETIVAAVRLMGLEDEAKEKMDTDLNFSDAKLIESKYPWAVGYVAVALENDLFVETETKVNPAANATRLWSTTVLVKALKLEDEAKELSNTSLDFKDAGQIPAASVGYVAVALEKGIITGYNDRTFRPNQPVSRAELAALLDRTDEEMPDHDAAAITGTLKADAEDGKITVIKQDDSELTLALDPDAFIFKDGKKAKASDLEAGDELFIRTYNNKAVFIDVTESAEDDDESDRSFREEGTVSAFSLNTDGGLSTISITQKEDGKTTVRVYNVDEDVNIRGDESEVEEGQEVVLKGEGSTVTSIYIQ